MLSKEKLIKKLPKIVDYLFKVKLYPYQIKIITHILNNDKKVTIRATTRAGKSFSVAIGAILYATFYDNKRIGIIAPNTEKTKIIMQYITQMLSSNQVFESVVDIDMMGLTKLERLRKEVSKKKITFKNKSYIEIRSIDINKKGFGVSGFAYDLVIIDESAEIPDDHFGMIYRMLLESTEAKMVEIYNPWNLGHTFKHSKDPKWVAIKIDSEDCMSCGRMTKEQIDDAKAEYTAYRYRVLIDAEFPFDIDRAIFTQDILDLATRLKTLEEYDKYLVGIDPARGGNDYTVATLIGEKDNNLYFLQVEYMDLRDENLIVQRVEDTILAKYPKDKIQIQTDRGINVGIADIFKMRGYKQSFEYVAGSKSTNKNKYSNRKSEDICILRNIMKDGRFWNLPESGPTYLELKQWQESDVDRLIKVDDPKDKSPDFADSLNIAISKPRGMVQAFTLQI